MVSPSMLSILTTFLLCSALISFISTKTEAKVATVSSLVSQKLFKKIFPHIDDTDCPSKGFYSYSSFINATKRFPEFGNTGSTTTRKREIAAFFAQISHQTTRGDLNTSGPYTYGLCLKEEVELAENFGLNFCEEMHNDSFEWNCNYASSYKGRGAMMIRWNFNYGPAGKALGYNLEWFPELVLSSNSLAFETALWVWMTARNGYPSCHNVMVGTYKPTPADLEANRVAGYGLTTNIIVDSVSHFWECGIVDDGRVQNRIGYFKRIAALFKVSTGSNLECANQKVIRYSRPPTTPPPSPSFT